MTEQKKRKGWKTHLLNPNNKSRALCGEDPEKPPRRPAFETLALARSRPPVCDVCEAHYKAGTCSA